MDILLFCLIGALFVAVVLGFADIPPFNRFFGSHVREAAQVLKKLRSKE
jgi:hypothetical protein